MRELDIEIRYWEDYPIMYVYHNNEWYAVLEDICQALGIESARQKAATISPMYQKKIRVPRPYGAQDIGDDVCSTYTMSRRICSCVNSEGIICALMNSRKLEARQFQLWAIRMLNDLYYDMGIDGRNVMSLTDKRIQETYDIKRHVDIEYKVWHPGAIVDSFIDDNSGELIYVCYNDGPDNYIEVPADLYDTWLTRDPTDDELEWLDQQEFVPYDPD